MEKRSSTIGDLMERRRILDGAKEYKGHTYLDLARFDDNTKHMIIFDVLTHNSPVGDKGERTRLFLGEVGYQKALAHQKAGDIKIISHSFLEEYDELNIEVAFKTAVANSVSYATLTLLLAGGDDSCRKKLKTGR